MTTGENGKIGITLLAVLISIITLSAVVIGVVIIAVNGLPQMLHTQDLLQQHVTIINTSTSGTRYCINVWGDDSLHYITESVMKHLKKAEFEQDIASNDSEFTLYMHEKRVMGIYRGEKCYLSVNDTTRTIYFNQLISLITLIVMIIVLWLLFIYIAKHTNKA